MLIAPMEDGADLGGSRTEGVVTAPGAVRAMASIEENDGALVTMVKFLVFSRASTPRRLPKDMDTRPFC